MCMFICLKKNEIIDIVNQNLKDKLELTQLVEERYGLCYSLIRGEDISYDEIRYYNNKFKQLIKTNKLNEELMNEDDEDDEDDDDDEDDVYFSNYKYKYYNHTNTNANNNKPYRGGLLELMSFGEQDHWLVGKK